MRHKGEVQRRRSEVDAEKTKKRLGQIKIQGGGD